MAINFDAITNINNIGTPGTIVTGNHTAGTLQSGVVFCFVTYNAGAIVSVTYNGVNMIYTGITASTSSGAIVMVWSLLNPPSGTSSVVVTCSVSATILNYTMTYSGVAWYNLISQYNTANSITGGTSITLALTTKTRNSWVIGWIRSNGSLTLGGSGYTSRLLASNVMAADTNGPLTAGTISTLTGNYTPTGAENMAVLLELVPYEFNVGLLESL